MTKEKNLSEYASFDVDDIVSEIKAKSSKAREATAYLDRSFILNMLKERLRQVSLNKLDSTDIKQIDVSDYNFTGADFRGIGQEHLELFDFKNCDITQVYLDREAIDYFLEYMRDGKVVWEGINFEGSNLSPRYIVRENIGIECNLVLDLSNLNLSSSIFRRANLSHVIFENTNISYSNFVDVINFDPKQLAFSIGFETAIFDKDQEKDRQIKDLIKKYSETLDPATYYKSTTDSFGSRFIAKIARFVNFLGD